MASDDPREERAELSEEERRAGLSVDREILDRPFRATVLSPRAWWRHTIFVVAAAATGLAALFFNLADRWAAQFTAFLQGKRALLGYSVPEALGPFLPGVAVIVGIVVVMRLRDLYFPGTQGTGIPQAIAALKLADGPIRNHMLSWRIAVGKALLLMIGLFAGGTIGREGPSVHVGACLMYLSARYARYPSWLVQRGLILGGGAAGIAAAFNAPIAGAIFAIEEIGRSFDKENAGAIVRAVVIASIVCLAAFGNYIFYGRVDAGFLTAWQWLLIVPIGLVGGTLGGLFASAVVWATPRVNAAVRQHPYRTSLLIGFGLALVGFLSDGLSYGSGYPEAREILIEGKPYPIHYPFTKAAGSFLSLVSGIPGGLFDPSLSIGAALGQQLAPWVPGVEPEAVVLLFMVSYFGGVVQSPITAAVILLEMTEARNMALPLFATSILGYEASHHVCRTSIYEALASIFLGDIEAQEASAPASGRERRDSADS